MPRQKKQHLKKRKDGRYFCRYKDKWFTGYDEQEVLEQREEYKRMEKAGELSALQCPTVSAYALKWLPIAKVGVSAQTYNEAVILMEKLIRAIGEMPLSEVKPSDIKAVYSESFLDYSDSYIRAGAQLYKDLFDAAQEDGWIRQNPARQKSAQPHKGYTGSHRAITDQERTWIETLCTDHRAHDAVMAMLYAGIRPQEAKAMNIDRSVDFDESVIHLMDFAHLDGSNHYKITEKGKTDHAVRTIPLLSPLKDTLDGKHGMLVTSADGSPVTIQAWKSVWESYVTCMETAINGMQQRWYRRTKEHKKILKEAERLRLEGKEEEARAKEAEIPAWISFTVVPYDLRHSFCTMCRDNGVELNTCVRWMGHADAKMILKIYDEVSSDRSKKEAERLEQALFGRQNGRQISKSA